MDHLKASIESRRSPAILYLLKRNASQQGIRFDLADKPSDLFQQVSRYMTAFNCNTMPQMDAVRRIVQCCLPHLMHIAFNRGCVLVQRTLQTPKSCTSQISTQTSCVFRKQALLPFFCDHTR